MLSNNSNGMSLSIVNVVVVKFSVKWMVGDNGLSSGSVDSKYFSIIVVVVWKNIDDDNSGNSIEKYK